jgi:hypothetical protein
VDAVQYPASFVIALTLVAGCAGIEDPEKGPEELPTGPVVEHGALPSDATDAATLSSTFRQHAWELDLAGEGGAFVEIITGPAVVGPDVDTVVTLYRAGAGDDALARGDDDDGLFAAIDGELEAGRYRVVVKGYAATTLGPFEVTFRCDGEACDPDPVPLPD